MKVFNINSDNENMSDTNKTLNIYIISSCMLCFAYLNKVYCIVYLSSITIPLNEKLTSQFNIYVNNMLHE